MTNTATKLVLSTILTIGNMYNKKEFLLGTRDKYGALGKVCTVKLAQELKQTYLK